MVEAETYFNSQRGKKSILTAVRHKTNEKEFDIDIRKKLRKWDEMLKKKTKEEWKKELRNSKQKKRDENYEIHKNSSYPDAAKYYKKPQDAYVCECGWHYSSKTATSTINEQKRQKNINNSNALNDKIYYFYKTVRKRIDEHKAMQCPIHMPYGIVPALPPQDWNDPQSVMKEFVNCEWRLMNQLCMFDLKDRKIQFDYKDVADFKVEGDVWVGFSASNDDYHPFCTQPNEWKQPREAIILEDNGEGWVTIQITEGNMIEIVNERQEIVLTTTMVSVVLKQLKWKNQPNIWIITK